MSCALWLHNYGLRPLIVERETALGGMARRSPYPNEGLLGQPDQSARENAAEFADHIGKLAVETWLGSRPAAPPARKRWISTRHHVLRRSQRRASLSGPALGDRDRNPIPRRGLARPGQQCAAARGGGPRPPRPGSGRRAGCRLGDPCRRDRRRRQCLRRLTHAGREGRAGIPGHARSSRRRGSRCWSSACARIKPPEWRTCWWSARFAALEQAGSQNPRATERRREIDRRPCRSPVRLPAEHERDPGSRSSPRRKTRARLSRGRRQHGNVRPRRVRGGRRRQSGASMQLPPRSRSGTMAARRIQQLLARNTCRARSRD